jgi:hypothetical protein
MSTATITTQARLILGDTGEPFQAEVEVDGTTARFELPVDMIDDAGLVVLTVDGVTVTTLLPGTGYTMDYRNGIINLAVVPNAGAKVIVIGSHYATFAPDDFTIFLGSAVAKHTAGVTPAPETDPAPGGLGFPPIEERLISYLTVIEALWAMATDAAQDVDIITPDGVSIPRSQRYAQIMQLIQYWQAQYDELAAALNVGIHRIEMFNLRRVSRTTNRLVPLYRAREYDDHSPPQRVLTPIDVGGTRLITYRGTWLATETYKRDDLVDYLGQRYIALQASTPLTPEDPSLDLDNSHWETSTINTGYMGPY